MLAAGVVVLPIARTNASGPKLLVSLGSLRVRKLVTGLMKPLHQLVLIFSLTLTVLGQPNAKRRSIIKFQFHSEAVIPSRFGGLVQNSDTVKQTF